MKSWNPIDDPKQKHVVVDNVIPVAGNFESSTGAGLDPKVSRLKAEDANSDGLLIELNGGKYNKRKQRAVLQLECDNDRTGTEEQICADETGEEKDPESCMDSLQFVSYGQVEGKSNMEVLRLNWKTKYACEAYAESDEAKKSGWGFFTWFILMYVPTATTPRFLSPFPYRTDMLTTTVHSSASPHT